MGETSVIFQSDASTAYNSEFFECCLGFPEFIKMVTSSSCEF